MHNACNTQCLGLCWGRGATFNIRITVEIFDLCVYFILHKKIHDRKTESLSKEHYNIFFHDNLTFYLSQCYL